MKRTAAPRIHPMSRNRSRSEVTVAAPPREVFAVMEQLLGTFPYRFEALSAAEARIVEHQRLGIFGQWSHRVRRPATVTCRAVEVPEGTALSVVARPRLGPRARAPRSRALQLVRLLVEGCHDQRTLYRRRRIPEGPVTLVASWAGTPYRLFTAPEPTAKRGAEITTAMPLEALAGGSGHFTRVRAAGGVEGFVESDQIVAAPRKATRAAQLEAARHV